MLTKIILDSGGKLANLSSSRKSVERWKPDGEQNQVRFQFLRFLNRSQSVGHFADDLQVLPFCQSRAEKSPERFKIIHDENPDE